MDLVEDYTKLSIGNMRENLEYIYALSFIAQIDYGTAYDSWYVAIVHAILMVNLIVLGSHILLKRVHADGSSINLNSCPKSSNYQDEVTFGND